MTKIAFYKGTSKSLWNAFQQWAIRAWTLGKYSHVEIINDYGSRDTKTWMWFAATSYHPGTTIARSIKFNEENWDIFELPTDVNYDEAYAYMYSKMGVKYDWLGIVLSQTIPLNIHDKKRLFCSEYVAKALKKTALFRGDTATPQSYSPNGLYRKLKKMDALK